MQFWTLANDLHDARSAKRLFGTIGSEEFYELLHEQVEIAEGVIRMLTHRLRDADAAIKKMKESGAD